MASRIVHVIPSLDRSGAEKQLSLLARGLPRHEFDLHVCALTRGGPLHTELTEAGVEVTVIGKQWKVDPFALRRLTAHLRALRPDLVQTWMFAANAYGRVAARRAGVPRLIAGERCVDRWKGWPQLTIDRRLARVTDRIVVNSTGVRDFYVDHRLPADKMVVIPNGVPAAVPSSITKAELLRGLALPPETRLIGTVGRLWPQKRMKDLIWAADLLKVIRDDVHLLIIGDGPQRQRLDRYRRQVRITDKVHMLGHRDDVAWMMPHFDVLWLASGYEGLPNVVMEALAAGVPVVATDIPGNRDLIRSGETGYLVPVGDRAAFARQTQKLLSDDAVAQRIGRDGRQRMIEEFSVEKMVQRFATLYREVLA